MTSKMLLTPSGVTTTANGTTEDHQKTGSSETARTERITTWKDSMASLKDISI